MTAPTLTQEQTTALDVARMLAAAGFPVFVAPPRPGEKMPFALPNKWDQLVADPRVVDTWIPGMAMGVIMGHGLDLLDIDPRNGGDLSSLGSPPHSYAIAMTPSGGMHSFIASLGVGSRDNIYPGIDIKGGLPDGTSRGLAFIAPTVGFSKVTGEPVPYRWLMPPDLPALATGGDTSGLTLANHVRQLRANATSVAASADDDAPDWWKEFADQREPHSEPAAQKAISGKLAEVVNWARDSGVGFRHTLERAAMTLGGYVGGGYLAAEAAQTALEEAVSLQWGAPDREDLLWISQGLTDGARKPFSVYTAADELLAAAGEAPTAWTIYSAIGTDFFNTKGTDQEMAQDVSLRIRPALRYAPGAGLWVVRDQHVWTEAEGMADWAVSTVARLMPLGDLNADKDTEPYRQAMRRGKFMGGGSTGICAKLKSIVRHPRDPMAVDLAELDADPEILWAGGMPWDLRASGQEPTLAAIDPSVPHLHTAMCSPVAMPTPRWDAFLAAVWPDEDVRRWVLRVLSIGLTGYADEALPVLWGDERNGKTSTISFLVQVLGSYAHAADPRLLAGVDNIHASVVYALKGRRLSFIDEGPRPGHLALERLKQLTGGGELTGNAMRANPITFKPTFTLVMTTNNEPTITDPAVAARMRIIPCSGERSAVRAARRALHPGVWIAEAPGVLAAMMREAAAWLADSDTARNEAAPESIRKAVSEMGRRQDQVAEWVSLCTVPSDPGDLASSLYRHFCEWFDASAVHRRTSRPSQTLFGRRLTALGFPASKAGSMGERLIYRPLSVLQGFTGPYVPPPAATANETSADRTSHTPGFSAAGHPTTPEGSANAEQTRSSPPNPPKNSEQDHSEPDISDNKNMEDVPDSSDTEVSGTVEGRSRDGCSAELSLPENPRSTPISSTVRDSRDSYSSLPATTTKNLIPVTHSGRGYHYTQRNRENENNCPDDLEPCPTSASPTTCNDAGRVGQNPTVPVILNGSTVPTSAQPAEVDHKAAISKSITDRLLASANAAKASQGPVAEKNVDLQTDKKPERGKLTDEQKAANKITKAEAAAAVKAATRLDKIADASGDMIDLPAVVVRGQQPRSVTVDEAMMIVRRAVVRDENTNTVDIESTAYPIGHRLHAVRTVQLGDLIEAVVFDRDEPAQIEAIKILIAEAPKLRAFSATADLAPLAYAGLIDHEDAWERMWDTVLPATLADPAGTGSDAVTGLKDLSGAMLGADAVSPAAEAGREALFKAAGWTPHPKNDTPHEKNGWAQVDKRASAMVTYAASDVLDTAALAHRLPDPGEALWERERTLQRLVARVSLTGLAIDGELTRRLLAEHQVASDAAAMAVRALGIENPASTQQVAARLTAMGVQLPRTAPSKSYPQGQLSADKYALLKVHNMKPGGELGILVEQLLEFGSHKNAISTFLRPYVYLCEAGDGRARPTIYTMEAATGRMSSVRPNVQNIPREGGFRAQILADQGFIIIGADESGVELRVAAALSQDQHLINIILQDDAAKRLDPKAKTDIHWRIAHEVYGPDAQKRDRYTVKNGVVFPRLYGSGIPGIARSLGKPESEVSAIVDVMDAMTPGLSAWAMQLRAAVKAGHTHFPTYSGRIVHLDRRMPHKAVNYVVQGTAREVIVDGAIRWSRTKWGRCTMWPVHDEIDVMVPEDEAQEATDTLVDCMEMELFGVPILATPSEPSKFWQDSV